MTGRKPLISLLLLALCAALPVFAQEVPHYPLPLLVTCTGQTPESLTFYALTQKLKIKAEHEPMIMPKDLVAYKTIVVAMGASLKGLGAAGLDQDEEFERDEGVFARARKLGIKIVGLHIGGEARRNTIADRFITPFAAQCDYLLVLAESNKDGLFTKIAKEKNIPLKVTETFAEMPAIVKEMFGQK